MSCSLDIKNVTKRFLAGTPDEKLALDDVLGCDSCMVGSRQPEGGTPCHPVVSSEDVLKRVVQSMAHVQDSGYVWWRHDDNKRLSAAV